MQAVLDMERALLGGMLIEESEIDNVIGKVQVDDFLHPNHRHIFAAIEDMYSQSLSCDMLSIGRHLSSLKLPGLGMSLLGELMTSVAATTTCEVYAERISESGRQRRVLEEAKAIINACTKGDSDGIASSMKRINEIYDSGYVTRIQTLTQAAHAYVEYLEGLESGAIANWKTNISLFDDVVNEGLGGGLRTKQLMMCCGRAGAGKTTIALYLVKELLRHNKDLRAAFFSLELSATSLSGKVVRSEMTHKRGDTGQTFIDSAKAGVKRVQSKYGSRIGILDHTGMSPNSILGMARKLAKDGVKVFVIDHLHRLAYPSLADLRHHVGDFCKKLTDFAKDHDCLFIVCAQLNRESEKSQRAPTTSDIAESGQVEQHADIILMVHPVMQKLGHKYEARRGEIYMTLAKNRHGPPKTTKFSVSYEHQRFTELEG